MRIRINQPEWKKAEGELVASIPSFAAKIHRDAAIFLQRKLVDDVLDGPGGNVYPKTGYPSGIQGGASGFVGVVSGNLKSSIQAEPESGYASRVGVNPAMGAVGDVKGYAQHVAEWSRRKYGKDFSGIAVELYGGYVLQQIEKEAGRMVREVIRGRKYEYRNPFNA